MARILVVEDDALTGLALEIQLRDLGAVVVAHHDAESATVQLREQSFDAAVIDVGLPGMRGDELACECRRRCPDMAIVLATGMSEHEVRTLFPLDGKVQILEKPYEFQALRECLRRLHVIICALCVR